MVECNFAHCSAITKVIYPVDGVVLMLGPGDGPVGHTVGQRLARDQTLPTPLNSGRRLDRQRPFPPIAR